MSPSHSCLNCDKYPKHGYLMWAAIIGGALLLEAEGIKRKRFEHTLSHTTRYVFKTHTPVGRTAFVAGWGALTWWFLPHVLNGVNTVSQAVADFTETLTEELTPDA